VTNVSNAQVRNVQKLLKYTLHRKYIGSAQSGYPLATPPDPLYNQSINQSINQPHLLGHQLQVIIGTVQVT